MSKGVNTSHNELSRPERAALAWHVATGHQRSAKACWCCGCLECSRTNPHHAAALRAALRDINARVSDSLTSARFPDEVSIE